MAPAGMPLPWTANSNLSIGYALILTRTLSDPYESLTGRAGQSSPALSSGVTRCPSLVASSAQPHRLF